MNGDEKHFKEKPFPLAINPYSYASKETLETQFFLLLVKMIVVIIKIVTKI